MNLVRAENSSISVYLLVGTSCNSMRLSYRKHRAVYVSDMFRGRVDTL
jgi:hypothetical protein